MDEFRIPKVAADIVCHTVQDESIAGQIFLDIVTASGYTLAQIVEFFNSAQPFFPFKTPQNQSILLNKQMILSVDLPGLFHEYESEVSSLLDFKRAATVRFTNGKTLHGHFIIDMPVDHARSLDLLNSGRRFLPFLMENKLALIHTANVNKVEES